MKNRYTDISARPHSALVGSPFQNVKKKFDADITRHHHVTSVSNARAVIDDQPEPVFAHILERRGYDPQAYRASQEAEKAAAAGSPTRAAGMLRSSAGMDFGGGGGGGGGSGISGSSEHRSMSPPARRKKTTHGSSSRKRRSHSPSSRHSSPAPPPSGGGGGGNSFAAHRSKLASRRSGGESFHRRGGGGGGRSPSPSSARAQYETPGGSPTGGQHYSSAARRGVSDAGLFRAAPAGSGIAAATWGGGGGTASGGSSPLQPQGGGGNFSASRFSTGNRSPPGARPGSGGGRGGAGGGGGANASGLGQQPRPVFGVGQNYQRWSNNAPNFGPGGDSFGAAMRGAQAYMDDAETVEVRREIQGAIEGFLYRPVARRFADETAKWVEDHIMPFAMVGDTAAAAVGASRSPLDRPNSAGSRSQNSGGTESSREGPDRGAAAESMAARRQRTLELTEALLPLVFHHIAAEIRDVVRMRVENALLKKETRTSYL